jgi:hypothetical protein
MIRVGSRPKSRWTKVSDVMDGAAKEILTSQGAFAVLICGDHIDRYDGEMMAGPTACSRTEIDPDTAKWNASRNAEYLLMLNVAVSFERLLNATAQPRKRAAFPRARAASAALYFRPAGSCSGEHRYQARKELESLDHLTTIGFAVWRENQLGGTIAASWPATGVALPLDATWGWAANRSPNPARLRTMERRGDQASRCSMILDLHRQGLTASAIAREASRARNNTCRVRTLRRSLGVSAE